MFDFRGWLGIEYPWKSRDLCEGSAASDKVLDWKTRPPPGRCRGNFVFTVFKPAAICVELLSRSDRATNDLADRFIRGLFRYHHQDFFAIDRVIFINVTMTCITRWHTVAHWHTGHPDEKTTPMKDHRSFSTTFSRNPFPAHLHLFKLLTKDHPSLSDHFGWLVRVVWHEGFHSSGTNGNISGHGSGNGSCSGAGSSCRSTK